MSEKHVWADLKVMASCKKEKEMTDISAGITTVYKNNLVSFSYCRIRIND